jgi:hypothetical protein
MKHVVKLKDKEYIHLDSYGESNVSHRVGQALCVTVVMIIAALTAGAILGVDISNPSPVQTQHETR